MALTEELVHYTKLSAKWEGVQERVRVNQTIITTSSNKAKNYVWRFTNRRAELWNSVKDAWDEDWDGWQQALDFWQQVRDAHGYKYKLWIAKPTEVVAFTKGKRPKLDRLGQAVSVLIYNPEKDLLSQWFRVEEWQETINYAPVDNTMFPRQWTWQNPASSTIARVKKGEW